MSLSLFFLILLGYILYRFVVGFALPVARTTRTMKNQFDQMKQQAGHTTDHQSATPDSRKQSTSFNDDGQEGHRTTSGRKGAKEDYIDFEEIPVGKY